MAELATLAQLQAAQEVVYAHLKPTPEICWPLLSERCGCEVWVKHENHTPIGAFKVRGGLTYLDDFSRAHSDSRGIISATRGNHGQPAQSWLCLTRLTFAPSFLSLASKFSYPRSKW